MELKSLNEYAREVMQFKNSPSKLSDIHIEISAKYSFLAEIMKDLQLEKAEFWQIKEAGDKKLSDAAVEAKWLQTEGGKKEIKMKWELRGLEKLMSAIKTSSVVSAIESRGSY